jgi:ligand-binding sensor domain-containing protein
MNSKNIVLKIICCFLISTCDLECQVITHYNTENSEIPFNTVRCIELQNNGLWVGTDAGLARFINNQWEIFDSNNSPLYSDDIRALKADGDSIIWIGTVNGGLFSYDGSNWENFNVSNSGLLDNLIRDINIDQLSNIWISTTEGLFMFDRTNWEHWNMQDNNLLTNNITSVQIGTHNEKYVGTINGGIIYFDSLNQYNEYTIINSDLPDNSVVAIEIDGNGQPWFLSPAAGLVNDTDLGGPWENFNNLNSGLPSNALNCLQFMDNKLVIGSEVSGLIFKDGESWQYINTTNSDLPDDNILSVKVDDLQNIWVGTFNAGLCKINLQNSIEEHLVEGVICYPNPIETQGEIHLNKSFSGTIGLYNSIGELLSLNQVSSCNSLTLPDNIEQGSYVITFSNDLSQSTQSIIVK